MTSKVAKELRKSCIAVKEEYKDKEIEITHKWALEMVPIDLFNFSCEIIEGKKHELDESGRAIVHSKVEEKAVLLSQQIMH